MISSKIASAMMPVEIVERKIEQRLYQLGREFLGHDRLASEKLNSLLKTHVRGKIRKVSSSAIAELMAYEKNCRKPCSCSSRSVAGDEVKNILSGSSFAKQYILPLLSTQQRSEKTIARHVNDLADKLEHAAIYCVLAALPVVKPLRALIDEVDACCREFDELKARRELHNRKIIEDRARGGRARHRTYRVLDRLTIHLLYALAPEGGWKNMAHAAEVVATRLGEVIVRCKRKIASRLEVRIRKVLAVIREQPRARATYDRHRAAQRTYRRRVQ